MFEWMPVLCGAVLGLLHRRAYIGQRTLLCLAVLSACIATATSGELFDEPLLILVDLALVVAGVIAIRILAAYPSARRSRSTAYQSQGHMSGPIHSAPASHTTRPSHTTLPVRAPHLRNTRSRTLARQTHHDDSL